MSESSELQARNWGIFCHLSALALWVGVPFGNIVIPLLIWLIKKDEMPLVNAEGKESLNFQISISIYALIISIVGIATIFIEYESEFLWPFALLLFVLALSQIVLVIIAAVKVSRGTPFKYPLTMRFIK